MQCIKYIYFSELMKEKKRIVEFAKENPQIKIITKLNPQRIPHVVGTYVGSIDHQVGIKNSTADEIVDVLYKLRNRSARETSSLEHWGKPQTKHPSIQGMWTPTCDPDSIIVKRRQ